MKKPVEMPLSVFFTALDQNFAQKPTPTYYFLMISNEMLEDSVNINKLCCNPVFLKKKKKMVKPLKNCFFGPKLHWGTALQINIIPLPVTMNRKIKKPPLKLNFRQSQ